MVLKLALKILNERFFIGINESDIRKDITVILRLLPFDAGVKNKLLKANVSGDSLGLKKLYQLDGRVTIFTPNVADFYNVREFLACMMAYLCEVRGFAANDLIKQQMVVGYIESGTLNGLTIELDKLETRIDALVVLSLLKFGAQILINGDEPNVEDLASKYQIITYERDGAFKDYKTEVMPKPNPTPIMSDITNVQLVDENGNGLSGGAKVSIAVASVLAISLILGFATGIIQEKSLEWSESPKTPQFLRPILRNLALVPSLRHRIKHMIMLGLEHNELTVYTPNFIVQRFMHYIKQKTTWIVRDDVGATLGETIITDVDLLGSCRLYLANFGMNCWVVNFAKPQAGRVTAMVVNDGVRDFYLECLPGGFVDVVA